MKLSVKLQDNKNLLQEKLNKSDVVFSDIRIGRRSALVLYVDALVSAEKIGDLILRPLLKLKPLPSPPTIAATLPEPSATLVTAPEEVISNVLDGQVAVIFDKYAAALSFDVKKPEYRAITEPPTSAVVKGPREGFTESIKANLSLVRKRLKTEKLALEKFRVGRLTKTDVIMVYLSDIADGKVIEKLKNRINKIDIDGIVDSSYIAKFVDEHKTSLFKQTGATEKPDVFTAKLLEGRVGVLVDGSPIALTVPYLMFEDFQSAEDYFQNPYRSNMERVVRLISIFAAIFLPSVFVSAQLFHLQIIPLNFLLTIVNSIKGIPLSPSLEMFFTLLIFEILNEASIRMPKYVGMALSIVGALVLGDTAVRAGIVSTPTIMIMALSGICLYTVPELVDSMSFLRLLFLLVAGSVGGFGIVLLCCFLVIYLTSLENFDTPFLAPFSPLVTDDLKDGVFMTFLPNMTYRPLSLKPKNKKRMKKEDE